MTDLFRLIEISAWLASSHNRLCAFGAAVQG